MTGTTTAPARWWQMSLLSILLTVAWLLLCRGRMPATDWQHTALMQGGLAHLLGAYIIVLVFTALLTLVSGWWRNRQYDMTLRRLNCPHDARLLAAAQALIPQHRLMQIADERCTALCVGLWRPAVYVSTGMVTTLAAPALRAVLAHEEVHRRRRDPLRLFLWQWCLTLFTPAPWLVAVMLRAQLRMEVRADRSARATTDLVAVATALRTILTQQSAHPRQDHQAVAGFGVPTSATMSTSILTDRLHFLQVPLTAPLPTRLPPRCLGRSAWRELPYRGIGSLAVSLIGVVLVLWLPAIRMCLFQQ